MFKELSKPGKRHHECKEYDLLIYEKGQFPQGLIGPIALTVKFGSPYEVFNKFFCCTFLHSALDPCLGSSFDTYGVMYAT
jgi:hypothetical protein